ncbi:MAG: hypothetical protein ACK48U_06260 [Planctomyces sp.]
MSTVNTQRSLKASVFRALLLAFVVSLWPAGGGWGVQAAEGERRSTTVPRFDAAVEKGLAYLRQERTAGTHGGEQVLAAYAMYKCGVAKTDGLIQKALAEAAGRSAGPRYQPVGSYDHIYGAGVDAMLMADIDKEKYVPNLQVIANYVQSVQRSNGSWSDTPTTAGDISMSQYAVLALWACQRAGCVISPECVERAADFLMRSGNGDGGWAYRPGTNEGPGMGNSTHNMTMAGSGSLGVCRIMLHGSRPKGAATEAKKELAFGALEKVEEEVEPGQIAAAFAGYSSSIGFGQMDARVDRAFAWNMNNFQPVSRVEHNMYFYYCIERAAAVGELGKINGQDWYLVYGDGLLTLQQQDGSFPTHSGPITGTSLALLYYMRSTDQILKTLYGKGQQRADKGNPFGDKKKQKEPTELDLLLASMENIDFSKLDETDSSIADDVVLSVQSIDDPAKLVGEVDRLKKLIRHPNAQVRRSVYWALGRTGSFALVPQMLEGLKDGNVDVNIEAEMALRFIARRPTGFGMSLDPLGGLTATDPAEQRLKNANDWRTKSYKLWSDWYFQSRPYEERDGLDELQAATFAGSKSADSDAESRKPVRK